MIINDMLKLFKVIIQSLIISRRRLFNKGKKNTKKTVISLFILLSSNYFILTYTSTRCRCKKLVHHREISLL